MKRISSAISAWYKKNKRHLPWRQTRDPYKIWLSEVILQQTRVEQGLAYYLKFIEHFPTLQDLAAAEEDKVLKLWQGLGYYSRARNLHTAAKQVMEGNQEAEARSQKQFPGTYEEILQLKGVGAYTAAAISSISFNEARAVVDGNVYRVLARVFGIQTPIDSVRGKKEFQQLADEMLDKKNPGDHNQAMMEFGARQCTPKNPACTVCPLEELCVAHRKKQVAQLPVKEKKTKTRTRYFYYFVFDYRGQTFIRKRSNEKDIWRNLFEFPLSDFSSPQPDRTILAEMNKQFMLGQKEFTVKEISGEYKHVLSHQVLLAKFIKIKLNKIPPPLKKEFLAVKKEMVNDYALPRLIDKYWNG